jgi:hypothetical protein
LETTQSNTHVAIRRLQEVHAATHPAGDGRQVSPLPAPPVANTTAPAQPPVVDATVKSATPAQPPPVGTTGTTTTPAQLPVVGATGKSATPTQPPVRTTGTTTTPALPPPVPAPDANGTGCWLPLPLPAAAGAQPPYVWAILLPYQWFADKLGQNGLRVGGHGALPAAGSPVAPNPHAERQA